MEYKVGDKVRLKNGKVVIINGENSLGLFGVYEDKREGVLFSLDDIESKILDIDGSNLEKLKEQYNKMGETIKQLEKEKEKTIYVPYCIKIMQMSTGMFCLFNDEGYFLSFNKIMEKYYISSGNCAETKGKYKLIKTTWGELNPGDICYCYEYIDYISLLSHYWLKLKDGTAQFWQDKNCANGKCKNTDIVYKIVLA